MNPLLDPANWRLMRIWTEGIEHTYPVWVGDPALLEQAMRELEAKNG
jgi:hypothetical protein